MSVLVLFGSRRGGTEGVARMVASALQDMGLTADVQPPGHARHLEGHQAVIVGGALYASRWPLRLRWYIRRHSASLRKVPVWFFSSGPLDDSAEREEIPPTKSVRKLMDRVLARGHATFGGRLAPDARGFPASAMAKKHAGDWRNEGHVRSWATAIGDSLAQPRPGSPGGEQPSPPPA